MNDQPRRKAVEKDRRRRFQAHALDRDELRRRVLASPEFGPIRAQLNEAQRDLAVAEAALALLWDTEAARMLGREMED